MPFFGSCFGITGSSCSSTDLYITLSHECLFVETNHFSSGEKHIVGFSPSPLKQAKRLHSLGMYLWIPKRSRKANEHFIHLLWTAMELWYNFTDRYDVAMELWIDAVHDYVFIEENERMNLDYGIDYLEIEWKRILNLTDQPSNSNIDDKVQSKDISLQDADGSHRNIENDIHDDEWNIAVIQLLIFVAGMCLDSSNILTARQCLFHAILQLLSQIVLQRTSLKNDLSTTALFPFEEPPLANGLYSINYVFKLLASALQEYIASYEEDRGQEISHWIVARRIATLRMSLLAPSNCNAKMNGSESTCEPKLRFGVQIVLINVHRILSTIHTSYVFLMHHRRYFLRL
jgi:hypothetical protein